VPAIPSTPQINGFGKKVFANSTTYAQQAFHMVVNHLGQVGINEDNPEDLPALLGRDAQLLVKGSVVGLEDKNVADGDYKPEIAAMISISVRFGSSFVRDVVNDPAYIASDASRKARFEGRLNSGLSTFALLQGKPLKTGFGSDLSFELRDNDGVNYELANVGAIPWYSSLQDIDVDNDAALSKNTGAVVIRPWINGQYAQRRPNGNFEVTTSTTYAEQKHAAIVTPHEGGRLGVNVRRNVPSCTIHAGADTEQGVGEVGGELCADKRLKLYNTVAGWKSLSVSNSGTLVFDGCEVDVTCAKRSAMHGNSEEHGKGKLHGRVEELETRVAKLEAMVKILIEAA